MFRKVFIIVMAFSLSMYGWMAKSNASPERSQIGEAALVSALQYLHKQFHSPDPILAEYYTGVALASTELGEFETRLNREHRELTLDRANIYTVGMSGQIGIYIPIRGGIAHSFFGLWYEVETAAKTNLVIALFTLNSDKNLTALIEINGQARLNAILEQNGRMVRGVAYDDKGNGRVLNERTEGVTTLDYNTCFNNCMARNGVPASVISAILSACDLVCPFTVLCYPCLVGASLFYGGAALSCDSCCITPGYSCSHP